MSLSPRNLVFWMTLFATVGTWLALPQRPSPLRVPSEPPPWIPLPASGMDASRNPVRQLLSFRLPGADFALRCGDVDDDGTDRYRLWISKNTWDDSRNYDFVVQGEWLDVSVRNGFVLSAPFPGAIQSSVETATVTEVHARLRLRDAEPIREAWDSPWLWHAEQGRIGCNDGRTMFLQACVRGRYAARDRNCDTAAFPEGQALWEAVTALLPAPRHEGERVP